MVLVAGDSNPSVSGKKKVPPLFFIGGSSGRAWPRLGRLAVIGARRVVEEVVPIAARLTLPQLAQLGDQFQVVAPFDVLDDFALVPPRGSAHQVHEAVCVARDEINWAVAHALALHQ